jgi:8-oxo-dGTP pyrophosphatase MutT (NUDIX family)
MDDKWIKRIQKALKKPLPGRKAQLLMSPSRLRPVNTEIPVRDSSVLILLYPCHGTPHTVLIKRTEYEGAHSGQISLPGGMVEKSDLSLSDTALREAMEETGVPVSDMQIIGELTPLHIPVSNFRVFPFVAVSTTRPDFRPDPFEVQFLIETGLDELIAPANHKTKAMLIAGNEVQVPYFDIQGNHIWGATAMILSEFLQIIESPGIVE